jgi:hypothetical protein
MAKISKKKTQRQQQQGIENPADMDVLSGRGSSVNYHPGNQIYRELVHEHKGAYVACAKAQKSGFAQLIVAEMRKQGSRFLSYNDQTMLWEEVEDKKAHLKAQQALREVAPDKMSRFRRSNKLHPQVLSEVADHQALNVLRDVATMRALPRHPSPLIVYHQNPFQGAMPSYAQLAPFYAAAPPTALQQLMYQQQQQDPRLVAAEARLAALEARLAAVDPQSLSALGAGAAPQAVLP